MPHLVPAALLLLCAAIPAQKTVRVFVLAGQSNMEGKAQNILLEHQAEDPKTAKLFAHLRDGEGWKTREDVFIKYGKRHGGLTMGYGSRKRTGSELEFGWAMGDACKEPVLLIKTCWGGHSLFQKFRSPSAGMPAEAFFEAELEKARKRTSNRNKKLAEQGKKLQPLPTMAGLKAPYGSSYRRMLSEVEAGLRDMARHFPELRGHEPVISGFVWFQGWNDQYNGAEKQYRDNLAHLIRDLRKEWNTPKLPVVIAAMGQNGSKPPKGAMKVIQDAQMSFNKDPEFKGTVRSFRTDVLVDKAAEELYPRWRKELELWKQTGSDHPYHYLGSAIWFGRIGKKMAEHMLALMEAGK